MTPPNSILLVAALTLTAARAAPDSPCDAAIKDAIAKVQAEGQANGCQAYESAVETCGGSGSVNLLYNAAAVCRKAPRCDLQVQFLSAAVARCDAGGCKTADAKKLAEDLAAAKANCRCGFSVAATRQGGALTIDGAPRGALPKTVEVGPGPHVVEARWTGGPTLTQTRNCEKPGVVNVSFEPPSVPPSPPPPTPRVEDESGNKSKPSPTRYAPWAWTAIGLGAVGIGVGTGFLLRAQGHVDDRDAAFRDLEEASAASDPTAGARYEEALGRFNTAHDDKSAANTVAVVGYVVGGAALVTGVTLLMLDRVQDDVSVAVAPGYLGLSAQF